VIKTLLSRRARLESFSRIGQLLDRTAGVLLAVVLGIEDGIPGN
jgi:hypothetical protein